MAEGTWKVTQVPADRVEQVIAEYEVDGPAKITKIYNPDGTYDLIIDYAKKPKSG